MLPSEYLQMGFTLSENAISSFHGTRVGVRELFGNRVPPDSPHAIAWTLHGSISAAWGNDDLTKEQAYMFYTLLYDSTARDPRKWELNHPSQKQAINLMRRIETQIFSRSADLAEAQEIFSEEQTCCWGCDRFAPRTLTMLCTPSELCFECIPFNATEEQIRELREWRSVNLTLTDALAASAAEYNA